MAVITLAEAKTLLKITDTSQDDFIEFIIPIIEDDIKSYCRQDFQDAPNSPPWEVWMKIPASKMIAYNINSNVGSESGMKSESQGGYSYTKADMAGGYPMDIMTAWDRAKVLGVNYAQKTAKANDRRGFTTAQILERMPVQGVDGVPLYED